MVVAVLPVWLIDRLVANGPSLFRPRSSSIEPPFLVSDRLFSPPGGLRYAFTLAVLPVAGF